MTVEISEEGSKVEWMGGGLNLTVDVLHFRRLLRILPQREAGLLAASPRGRGPPPSSYKFGSMSRQQKSIEQWKINQNRSKQTFVHGTGHKFKVGKGESGQ